MPTSTYLDLLQQAAGELNLVAIADSLVAGSPVCQRLLDRLVLMVDSWNLKPTIVPWYDQHIFNLNPGQQTYLIGPNAPDWNASLPIRLNPEATNLLLTNPVATGISTTGYYPEFVQCNGVFLGGPPYSFLRNGASLGSYPISIFVNSLGPGAIPGISTSATPVRIPLAVLSVDQYANITLPYLQNSYPSGCYLDRSVVTGTNNGQPYTASRISVWGIPTTANQIEFFYWHVLTVGNLTDPVNASTGYFRAMFLNLALEIAPGFGIQVNPLTIKAAADALADIKEANVPDMSSVADRGMPNSKLTGYISRAQFLSGNF